MTQDKFSKTWPNDEPMPSLLAVDDDAFWRWYHKVCGEAYKQHQLNQSEVENK